MHVSIFISNSIINVVILILNFPRKACFRYFYFFIICPVCIVLEKYCSVEIRNGLRNNIKNATWKSGPVMSLDSLSAPAYAE
jgi:hypothetical protein